MMANDQVVYIIHNTRPEKEKQASTSRAEAKTVIALKGVKIH